MWIHYKKRHRVSAASTKQRWMGPVLVRVPIAVKSTMIMATVLEESN